MDFYFKFFELNFCLVLTKCRCSTLKGWIKLDTGKLWAVAHTLGLAYLKGSTGWFKTLPLESICLINSC